jgi:hypothetical protein
MKKISEIRKRQGLFLTIMILFLVIGDLQIPYYLANPDTLYAIYREIPSWYAAYALVGLASNIAIIVGMWKMKKWAVYLLAAYFASKILVDSFYILPSQQLMVTLTTLVGAGLWAWAIYRKRALFS